MSVIHVRVSVAQGSTYKQMPTQLASHLCTAVMDSVLVMFRYPDSVELCTQAWVCGLVIHVHVHVHCIQYVEL